MRKIPNSVYTSEEVILNNEEKDIPVVLRPLPIARLREFTAEWSKMADLFEDADKEDFVRPTEDQIFDIYIRCCAVALKKQLAPYVDNRIYTDTRDFHPDYIELLEDYLDMATIVRVLEVCGGVELTIPKSMEIPDNV